jgi:hypothetical protein
MSGYPMASLRRPDPDYADVEFMHDEQVSDMRHIADALGMGTETSGMSLASLKARIINEIKKLRAKKRKKASR